MEGLYLIHTREFISTKKPIYKIGRGENVQTRVLQYPNGSNLLFLNICKNSKLCETNLIRIFKKKFLQEKYYGREYFSGDVYEMIDTMYDNIKLHNKKCTEEENKNINKLQNDNNIDIKPEVKTEVKTEVKPEIKTEIKTEVKTEVKLEVTQKITEEIKNTIYICPKCKFDFKYKSILIRHLTNSVRCLSTNIYIKDTIDKIINTNININNDLFMCHDCNKYFKFKTSIYRHQTISKCAKNKHKI